MEVACRADEEGADMCVGDIMHAVIVRDAFAAVVDVSAFALAL